MRRINRLALLALMFFASVLSWPAFSAVKLSSGQGPVSNNISLQYCPEKERGGDGMEWVVGAVLGICALSITVVAGITIRENVITYRRNKQHRLALKDEAEKIKKDMRARMSELEAELERDMRTQIDLMVRAKRLRSILNEPHQIDIDCIYDDVRQLCESPSKAHAPVYVLIRDRIDDPDLKAAASRALQMVEAQR